MRLCGGLVLRLVLGLVLGIVPGLVLGLVLLCITKIVSQPNTIRTVKYPTSNILFPSTWDRS